MIDPKIFRWWRFTFEFISRDYYEVRYAYRVGILPTWGIAHSTIWFWRMSFGVVIDLRRGRGRAK